MESESARVSKFLGFKVEANLGMSIKASAFSLRLSSFLLEEMELMLRNRSNNRSNIGLRIWITSLNLNNRSFFSIEIVLGYLHEDSEWEGKPGGRIDFATSGGR
ncbi:hypothetical protein Tco_0146360 [Tanacetum coccineum]